MKTIILILSMAFPIFSQWETGASYKIKSETPKHGIGININRNLPFQGATFGIHLRAEVNLFRETASVNFTGINEEDKFLSEDYNLHIIGNYFFRYFTPYFGFGLGYGELSTIRQSWQGFVLSLVAGNKFNISDIVNPYLEIQLFNYFADFESRLWGKSMSTYQIRGAIGINISINTLSN
ncbi:MAG: hypothetical protein EHM47_14645 [Ignavibacteriales bacterium]|nr:MAG: hypothetical protein EHM47_14645 [Ignavibacteriales bacterium]